MISDRLTSGTRTRLTSLIGQPNLGHPAMTTKATVMSSISAERSVSALSFVLFCVC